MSERSLKIQSGFTLLEVLVALTILALGVSIVLSLISGSLGNIRKVQLRTRLVEHAASVMETALLNDSILQPTSFAGDFLDGTRWSVRVDEFTPDAPPAPVSSTLPPKMPVRMLQYTVEMYQPGSGTSDYRLQTLKLVKAEDQAGGPPR